MPTKQKKSARELQHKKAIRGYKAWLKENPNAKRRSRISSFDAFVDSSELPEELLSDGS